MNILITGCGSGIGQYLALSLAQNGHVIFGLPHAECDVSDYDALCVSARTIAGRVTHLDCLIACAAIQGPIGKAHAMSVKDWSRTIDIDLKGSFYAWHAFYSLLSKSVRAKTLFFGGGGATGPRPNFSAYASAKVGIVRLAESLAEEYPEMDFFAIAPGKIRTKMTAEVIAAGPALAGQKEYEDACTFDEKGLPRILQLVEHLITPLGTRLRGRLIAAQWDPWDNLPNSIGLMGLLRRQELLK